MGPEGWVEFTATPSESSDGYYGAQWWLGGVPESKNRTRIQYCDKIYQTRKGRPKLRLLPIGTLLANGYEGQTLAVIPDKELVIVRLGRDTPTMGENYDLIRKIAELFPP